jgi:hypothetical protein
MISNKNEKESLIFGLTPFATEINSILLLLFSSILNAVYFCVHLDEKSVDFTKTPIDNPWYISYPLFVLSWLMFIRYIEWKHDIGNFTIKSFLYKLFYLIILVVIESFVKIYLIKKLVDVL